MQRLGQLVDEPGQQALLSALYYSSWLIPRTTEAELDLPNDTHGSSWGSWHRRNYRRRPSTSRCSPTNVCWPVRTCLRRNSCRYSAIGKINRIDRVFEFQLDKRQLTETTWQEPVGQEAARSVEESGPLPAR